METLNKLKILVKQLYKQKLGSKSFISLTLMYIVIMAIVLYWSEISSFFLKEEPIEVTLVNETEIDMSSIFISSEDIQYTISEQPIEELHNRLEQDQLDAVVVLSEADNNLKADIVTYNPLQLNDQSTINSHVEYAAKIFGIQSLNLSSQDAERILNSQPIITTTNLNEDVNGKSEGEKQSGMWVSYVVGIVIYFFITTYLSMITTDVASEKGSRALEMLLVSVKPSTHFQSKLLGVFLIALTQFAIIVGALIALIGLKSNITPASDLGIGNIASELSFSYIIYVVAFIFFTVILFLILGALFGSLVSKVEEASQVMTPAIMVLLVGFYVMISGVANPDTILIKVFSYIPLTSGMVMPMRVGATDLSPIEPILSLAVLILSVVILYVLSLSFYKRSVLTYSSGGVIQKIKTVLKVTT